MVDRCPGCGSPAGTGLERCTTCSTAKGSPTTADDADRTVADRVERYFVVASLQCPNCRAIHTTVTIGDSTYTAADFGIESIDEWELELDKELTWLRDHRREVEAVLPALEVDWPRSVAALRSTVL